MKILNIANNHLLPTFKAGKSILYTDFDGTFLAQPLYDVYNGSTEAKKQSVNNFNSYFRNFQDYIEKTNGKFSINITTGRRLNYDDKEGVEPTYLKMKQEGIIFPKIKSLITSSGGDIYYFNQNGSIDHTPSKTKASQIKQACGWDNEEIKNTLDDIAKELECNYSFTDDRGNYKLSIQIKDSSKINRFYQKICETLNPKMNAEIKISDVKVKSKNSHQTTRTKGIKLKPLIGKHHIHKDFDIKIALKNAIRDNDFLIVAGDADNDKEALNIFKYLKNPPNGFIPTKPTDITAQYLKQTKKEIDSLPIKLLFIRPKKTETNPKVLELLNFMEAQQKLFPKKVEIIEKTQIGKDNNLLDAIKSSTINYAKKNLAFAKKFDKKLYNKQLLKFLVPVLGFLALTTGILAKFIIGKTNNQKTMI